jgi:MFS transporter, ACS family, allantoate permease
LLTSIQAFILLLAWNASSHAGHSKKIVVNSMALITFCVGNILGTQTLRSSQAPGYIGGKISIMVMDMSDIRPLYAEILQRPTE